MYPLCCQVLIHHGTSMTVPRFTFFTENFVIRSNQVTKMFRPGLHARFLQQALDIFRFQADIAIRVLRKVRVFTVLTRTWFHFCSRLHWKFMRLEPSTFFPWVENPNLANEMRSIANADDFTRFPNPVEDEVANLKFSGGTSRGRRRQ